MLEIPLTPTPVSFYFLQKSGGDFFVAPVEIIGEPDFPASPAHKSCFHKVVTQNVASPGWLAWKLRQTAVFHERFNPNNGVMSPEMRIPELQIVKACGEHRPISMVGKLLAACDGSFPVHRKGRTL
jgi:hypothetical protein